MAPYLWIAYDYISISDCLQMLDTILAKHPEHNIIHEIGRPTIIHAAREGVPIVAEFRKRLANCQILVADFKGYDVPYSSEGKYYYAEGTDLVTVMGMAPNEAIKEAINGAKTDNKLVAFDLMSYVDDDSKVNRAIELVEMGAKLISCHTGWNEQAVGKTPKIMIDKVYEALKHTEAQIIAMGGLKPDNVKELKKYVDDRKIFAIVSGSAITRSNEPNAIIDQFLGEISKLNGQLASPPSPIAAKTKEQSGLTLCTHLGCNSEQVESVESNLIASKGVLQCQQLDDNPWKSMAEGMEYAEIHPSNY